MLGVADEADVRREIQALLRYANKTKVAEALGVSPQAVKNWADGRYPSPQRLDEIRRLFELDADAEKEPAPPQWVERVLASLMAWEARDGVTDEELAQATIDAAAFLAVARGRQPRRAGGGGGGAAET